MKILYPFSDINYNSDVGKVYFMTKVNLGCADENSENIASRKECEDAVSQIRHLDKRVYFDRQSYSGVVDGWCSVSGGSEAKKK